MVSALLKPVSGISAAWNRHPLSLTDRILLTLIVTLASVIALMMSLRVEIGQSSYNLGAYAPLCMSIDSSGQSSVTPVASFDVPFTPNKRVTVLRVVYGPGGFTPRHRHAGNVTAFIIKGKIRSQLAGEPLQTFGVGGSFYEPPGAIHLVSANASTIESAELIAVFVHEEGAELTTFVD